MFLTTCTLGEDCPWTHGSPIQSLPYTMECCRVTILGRMCNTFKMLPDVKNSVECDGCILAREAEDNRRFREQMEKDEREKKEQEQEKEKETSRGEKKRVRFDETPEMIDHRKTKK